MTSEQYKFEGWMGLDKQSAEGNMIWQEFQPKRWEETDVDIKGPTTYPCCVGHEIIGIVVRVGAQVEGDIKVGDRVGVGAQCDSCLGRLGDCEECASDMEQYCSKRFVGTYAGVHLNGDLSQGGYALYYRSPSHFVVKIPEELPSEHAAPMLCAGLTTYSPLKQYDCGPGKRVGIIGLGGLGHFAVLWAKALGADKVAVISRKAGKRADALHLGADVYIATDDEHDWVKNNIRSLDIILSTVSSSKMPMGDYLSLLRKDGVLIQVGNPDDGVFQVPAPSLIMGRIKLVGSLIGSPQEIREMLQLAVEKKVKPWVEVRRMKDANQAIIDMANGKARYRYVLAN